MVIYYNLTLCVKLTQNLEGHLAHMKRIDLNIYFTKAFLFSSDVTIVASSNIKKSCIVYKSSITSKSYLISLILPSGIPIVRLAIKVFYVINFLS